MPDAAVGRCTAAEPIRLVSDSHATEPHSNHCDCGGYFGHIRSRDMTEKQADMIDVLEGEVAQLFPWEANFVAEVGGADLLTANQSQILKEIYDRVTQAE